MLWKRTYASGIIVRKFEIYRASRVTKNLDYSCVEIRVFMNSKPSVFLVRTT